MDTKTDFTRRCVATILATVMLSLSIALPIMERGDVSGRSAVESSHDPSRCGHGHDHRICTQVGANFSLTTSGYESRLAHVAIRVARPSEPHSAPFRTFLEGPPSRAPPLG